MHFHGPMGLSATSDVSSTGTNNHVTINYHKTVVIHDLTMTPPHSRQLNSGSCSLLEITSHYNRRQTEMEQTCILRHEKCIIQAVYLASFVVPWDTSIRTLKHLEEASPAWSSSLILTQWKAKERLNDVQLESS